MPVLQVMCQLDTGFSCGIEGWFQRAEEKQEWQRLVTHMLQYALTGRAVTAITLSPMQWSMGWSMPGARLWRAHQAEYLVNRIEHATDDLLAEIAGSEDFQRGLLWLFARDLRDEAELRAAVGPVSVTAADLPVSSDELLLLLEDGRWLQWLHPHRDAARLAGEVVKRARAFGWTVSEPP